MVRKEKFPVVAYTLGGNGATMYVAHLPSSSPVGNWGYTNREQGNVSPCDGKTYDKARPLTETQFAQFVNDCRALNQPCFCYSP